MREPLTGGIASSFTAGMRLKLRHELAPLEIALDAHPWRRGFGTARNAIGRLAGATGGWDPATMSCDWIPLRPERICEVAFDQVDGGRFPHPARFLRWRPDREAASVGFEQLAEPTR